MEIKKAQFKNEDPRLPTVFAYKIESGYLYFTEYRVNGSNVILRIGNIEVAVLTLRDKEIKHFKNIFNDARVK